MGDNGIVSLGSSGGNLYKPWRLISQTKMINRIGMVSRPSSRRCCLGWITGMMGKLRLSSFWPPTFRMISICELFLLTICVVSIFIAYLLIYFHCCLLFIYFIIIYVLYYCLSTLIHIYLFIVINLLILLIKLFLLLRNNFFN